MAVWLVVVVMMLTFYVVLFLPGTWGLNDKGQLGLGDTEAREYPTQVLLPRSIK